MKKLLLTVMFLVAALPALAWEPQPGAPSWASNPAGLNGALLACQSLADELRSSFFDARAWLNAVKAERDELRAENVALKAKLDGLAPAKPAAEKTE